MSAFIKKLHDFFKAASKPIGLVLTSAFTWLCVSGITGLAAISYGILLLFGEGYALITFGAFLLLFTSMIARGMTNG